MAQVTGIVEGTHDKWDKVNVQVGGKWYSTKAEYWKGPKPQVGFEVSFDDGGKNYLQQFNILSGNVETPNGPAPTAAQQAYKTPSTKVADDPRQAAIIRQNALTNAVAYSDCDSKSPEDIIEVAKIFYTYTSGQLED